MGFAIRQLDTATGPDPGDAIAIHSQLAGPIESLSFLRQSLLFAELAEISYLPRAIAGRLANQIGLPEIRFYDQNGAQAYLLGNDDDAVLVCRGTEPHDWNDVRADLLFELVVSETVGRVHRGFKQEVDDLWPRLEMALVNNSRTLWFTGHSLGGAMAAICAGRCALSHIRSNPRALFTYGSPRIGTHRYVNFVAIESYRWTNNNDIVSRVPPPWLGYRHKGRQVYLDSNGEIRRLTAWQRAKDRWRGFVRGLKLREFDPFTDHSIRRYIAYIRRAAVEEEQVVRWSASPLQLPTAATKDSVPFKHRPAVMLAPGRAAA